MLNPSPPDTRLTLTIDGRQCRVEPGVSIAVAMSHAGIRDFAGDRKGRKRGVFCGMGLCHECLVSVNGKMGQRACMTQVAEGMRVERQRTRPDLLSDDVKDLCQPPKAIDRVSVDILVIGAGPAGLSAAQAAAFAGASVLVIDERPKAGGQFFKQPSSQTAKHRFARDPQTAKGAELIARLRELNVEIRSDILVWGAQQTEDGKPLIGCNGPDRAFYVHPQKLVIATGAYERPAPFTGWTLPGVITTGAAQTLLRSFAHLPGQRILIAGNGPLNIQVACEIRKAGGEVVALADRAMPAWRLPITALSLLIHGPGLAWKGMCELVSLKAQGVSFLWQSRLHSVSGDGQVEKATIETPSGLRSFDVDTVLIGGDFTPSNELSCLLGLKHELSANGSLTAVCTQDGESSNSHIHIIGEAARFGGAHIAMAAGRNAGLAVARKLGFTAPSDKKTAARLKRARAFQDRLWTLFDGRDEKAVTPAGNEIACRCESVGMRRLAEAAVSGAPDSAVIKRLTRAGMGRCQGRYCSRTLRAFSAPSRSQTQGIFAPQMPLRPVPLAALSVEKTEWSGHKRSVLPHMICPPSTETLPVKEVGTVIVGAGIAGLSTALFLAEAGEDVAVIERGFPGGLASGGNAGSLHAQLLSFDHGARAENDGGPAARTLPLQLASINLWRSLERRLNADFELKISGGLMLAETDEQMRFLEQKAAVERQAGIECHVIGKEALQRLEPALSDTMIGAAFCPQEGKINPLTATDAVRKAAEKAGAGIFNRTDVLAMNKTGAGFTVTTSRGCIRAGRVVNAGGAFAAQIGSLLDLAIPVFGAPLQMVVTEAAAPCLSHLVAHADRHLTLKQAANGTFLIGGGWTAGLDPVHAHPRPYFDSIEGNLWVAQHVLPGLKKLHVVRSWAAMNIDIDGAPILGEHPDMPGFFNVVTSNGYTLGPLVGRITAALVRGDDPGVDLSAFSISRFKRGHHDRN